MYVAHFGAHEGLREMRIPVCGGLSERHAISSTIWHGDWRCRLLVRLRIANAQRPCQFSAACSSRFGRTVAHRVRLRAPARIRRSVCNPESIRAASSEAAAEARTAARFSQASAGAKMLHRLPRAMRVCTRSMARFVTALPNINHHSAVSNYHVRISRPGAYPYCVSTSLC